MLGHLMEWLYSGLGGISFDTNASLSNGESGWRQIVIDPQMVGDIKWAKTSLNTPEGMVKCQWMRNAEKGKWSIDVSIPKNSEAQIHLPDGSTVNKHSGKYHFKGKIPHIGS